MIIKEYYLQQLKLIKTEVYNMLLPGDQVNYKREIIKETLYHLELDISEYEEFSPSKLRDWLSKLPNGVQIETHIYEEAEGFDYGHTVVHFLPFIRRKENDKEYNERILEEETEYNALKERERLIKEENAQYRKDLDEFNRIKEQYHLE